MASGCVSFSYTATGGGGYGQDASYCITLSSGGGSGGTLITNSCDAEVNFIEYSTGSAGLLVIPANEAVPREETIFAWGACIVPATPQRTEDFDYYCRSPD